LLRGAQSKSQPLWSLKSEEVTRKKKKETLKIVLQNSVINKWERNLNFSSIRAYWWLIYQRKKVNNAKNSRKFSRFLLIFFLSWERQKD
jgi:hypothetical protein